MHEYFWWARAPNSRALYIVLCTWVNVPLPHLFTSHNEKKNPQTWYQKLPLQEVEYLLKLSSQVSLISIQRLQRINPNCLRQSKARVTIFADESAWKTVTLGIKRTSRLDVFIRFHHISNQWLQRGSWIRGQESHLCCRMEPKSTNLVRTRGHWVLASSQDSSKKLKEWFNGFIQN